MTIFDATGTRPVQQSIPTPQPTNPTNSLLHPQQAIRQFDEAIKAERAKDGAADTINGLLVARLIEELAHHPRESVNNPPPSYPHRNSLYGPF
jgi:hypothetical protein